MHVAAMLTSLPLDFAPAAHAAAGLGFRHVDVAACVERPPADLEALAADDLVVSCAAVGRGLPEGWTLDAPAPAMRRDALEAMKRQVADAARLGARVAYVVPGFDAAPAALARFGEACALLAEFAAGLRVRLGVEHFPGRALPSVAATLEWLEAVGHANFGLLLDVGHCQISGEEPAAAVRRAGARLAYVHFDDNDGVGDVHWPLLTGRLTEAGVRDVFTALRAVGYDGGLALELHPATPDVAGALRDGKALLDACLARSGGA